jgi:hypothetical protein
LQACSSEAALDVEALVGVAAVEDALVAANLLGDKVEGLDESEAELLALLILGDGDVLDVADLAQAVDAGEEEEKLAGHWATSGLGGGEDSSPPEDKERDGCSNLQLVLDYQGASSHDRVLLPRRVFNNNDVIVLASHHVVVLLLELFLANVADRRQHPEALEEAGVVVGAAKGSQLVALGQGGGDVWRDEVLGEEAILRGRDGDGRDRGG